MAQKNKYFVKIAQAGPTIDERELKEDWLKDIAETYSPDTYAALIWPEHCRYFGNYGQVEGVELKNDEKGRLSLYAHLAPNQNLLWENAWGQKLFYSLEVDEDFAGTGKAYLTGLGVTDSPASLGLESTRFSKRSDNKKTIFLSNTSLDSKSFVDLEADNFLNGSKDAGGFLNYVKAFFTDSGDAPKDQGENPQKDEEMEKRIENLEESLSEMKDDLEKVKTRLDALEKKDEPVDEPTESSDDFKALTKKFETLNKNFESMLARMEKANPGTQSATNTGEEQNQVF